MSSLFMLKSLRLAGQFPSMRNGLESESESISSIFYLLLEFGLLKNSSLSCISSVFSEIVLKLFSIFYLLFCFYAIFTEFWLKSYSNFGLFAPIPERIFLNL